MKTAKEDLVLARGLLLKFGYYSHTTNFQTYHAAAQLSVKGISQKISTEKHDQSQRGRVRYIDHWEASTMYCMETPGSCLHEAMEGLISCALWEKCILCCDSCPTCDYFAKGPMLGFPTVSPLAELSAPWRDTSKIWAGEALAGRNCGESPWLPLKRASSHAKRKVVLQPSIFRCGFQGGYVL